MFSGLFFMLAWDGQFLMKDFLLNISKHLAIYVVRQIDKAQKPYCEGLKFQIIIRKYISWIYSNEKKDVILFQKFGVGSTNGSYENGNEATDKEILINPNSTDTLTIEKVRILCHIPYILRRLKESKSNKKHSHFLSVKEIIKTKISWINLIL